MFSLKIIWEALITRRPESASASGMTARENRRPASGDPPHLTRPIHVEHGHAPGCARLAADRAAEAEENAAAAGAADGPFGARRGRYSDTGWPSGSPVTARGAVGTATSTTTFAALDRDWSAAVLRRVARRPVSDPHGHRPVLLRLLAHRRGVGRGRCKHTRSDYEFPDLGQMLTWRLYWQHTPMLIDVWRGNCE